MVLVFMVVVTNVCMERIHCPVCSWLGYILELIIQRKPVLRLVSLWCNFHGCNCIRVSLWCLCPIIMWHTEISVVFENAPNFLSPLVMTTTFFHVLILFCLFLPSFSITILTSSVFSPIAIRCPMFPCGNLTMPSIALAWRTLSSVAIPYTTLP